MTLSDAAPGSTYLVSGLELPLDLARRLGALGLIEDSEVLVLRKKSRDIKRSGAMIINVRGTRFAVGGAIARHINVREAEADGR